MIAFGVLVAASTPKAINGPSYLKLPISNGIDVSIIVLPQAW